MEWCREIVTKESRNYILKWKAEHHLKILTIHMGFMSSYAKSIFAIKVKEHLLTTSSWLTILLQFLKEYVNKFSMLWKKIKPNKYTKLDHLKLKGRETKV